MFIVFVWIIKSYVKLRVNYSSYLTPQQTLYGNIDIGHVKTNKLDKPVRARYIRFIPVSWKGDLPCLRVEAYECIPRKGIKYIF